MKRTQHNDEVMMTLKKTLENILKKEVQRL
jgi:hypothetical protein